ncbi:MAG: hypothetical protein Q9217_001792 [Psora testacea]
MTVPELDAPGGSDRFAPPYVYSLEKQLLNAKTQIYHFQLGFPVKDAIMNRGENSGIYEWAKSLG